MRFHQVIFFIGVSILLSACTINPTTPKTTDPTPETKPDQILQPESSILENEDASDSAAEKTTYTLAEVKTHNNVEDCWLVIHDQVYDVTGFNQKHAGGDAILEGCGQDATEYFETRPMGSGTPHSDKARDFLPNFYIGDLDQ